MSLSSPRGAVLLRPSASSRRGTPGVAASCRRSLPARTIRSISASLAFALVLVAGHSVAHADPVVIVEVRRDGAPAEATVFLRDADGVTGTCRTSGGTCRIERVPAGRHYVWARDEAGRESVERPVMLPPDGEVTLVVAAP